MDTFTTMTGVMTIAMVYIGERFQAGVYLWLAALFSVIFALRMAEPMFYIATAGLLAVLAYRTFGKDEDVREDERE